MDKNLKIVANEIVGTFGVWSGHFEERTFLTDHKYRFHFSDVEAEEKM